MHYVFSLSQLWVALSRKIQLKNNLSLWCGQINFLFRLEIKKLNSSLLPSAGWLNGRRGEALKDPQELSGHSDQETTTLPVKKEKEKLINQSMKLISVTACIYTLYVYFSHKQTEQGWTCYKSHTHSSN